MDNMQLRDEIAAIDRQLYDLRDKIRPIEHAMARGRLDNLTEEDYERNERLQKEVRRLSGLKDQLRARMSSS